jgi:hypothetical protein
MGGCGCKKKNIVEQPERRPLRKVRFIENSKQTQSTVNLTPDQEKQVNDIVNKLNQLK